MAPAGSFATDNNGDATNTAATSTEFCAAGRYSAVHGQSECDSCEGGTYSDFKATACVDVQAGYFAADANDANTSTEAVKEIQCAAGRYGSSTQAYRTYCTDCADGHYSIAGTDGSCTAAVAGKYVIGSDGAAVSDSGNLGVGVENCLAGYYSAPLAMECIICGGGKYSDTAATGCTSLAAGHYGAYTTDNGTTSTPVNEGANLEVICPAGFFAAAEFSGNTTCDQSAIGYYTVDENNESENLRAVADSLPTRLLCECSWCHSMHASGVWLLCC